MTLRIVFMGTPLFAVPCLQALAKSDFELVLVITAPDAPAGRGRKICSPAVKKKAEELGVTVFQPEHASREKAYEIIAAAEPTVIAVVAYGQILKENLLGLPQLGCINVHPSLLPKYRGAAPIQHTIMNGETITGVTTILMNERTDSGDVLLRQEMPIGINDTGGTLSNKLEVLSAHLLIKTLKALNQDCAENEPQVDSDATFAPALNNDDSQIVWSKQAIQIHNLVRALNPKPGAQTSLSGNLIKIWNTHIPDKRLVPSPEPGTIVRSTGTELWVATGKYYLAIDELQSQGRKKLRTSDWLRGTRLEVGQRLRCKQ